MSTSPPPSAEKLAPSKRRFGAAGASLRPLAAAGLGRGIGFVAPHARRVGGGLRGIPALAKMFDRVGASWDRLVEAFCQAAEPLLARHFPEHRLVAVADAGGGLTLHRIGRESADGLGPIEGLPPDTLAGLAALRWTAIELRLPPTQILERKLSLPAASREFLAPILEHRLDRLTPWRADRVLYGFRTADTGDTAGSVAVTVTATSRDLVAAPLGRLEAAGLAPTAIGADIDGPTRPLDVDLLGSGAAPPRAESRRFVSRVALVGFAALALAFAASALIASSASADRDASTQKLGKARRLLRSASFANLGAREQAMLEAKQPARSTMMLVDTLAANIPADTFLKDLTVSPDKVRLVGSSANAPALIGKLEAAGLLNVRFTSTIARDRSGRDDFELGADRPVAKAEDPR